ncbi:MAG: DUF1810 domain-containing protein [Dehalococcoidia bacterium]
MTDRYDLQRFIDAQEPVYDQVTAELRRGRKRSHWMWFVFPQLRGLGSSLMAHLYGITGREEAAAYASHPVLGARLRECTSLVLDVDGSTASEIFGSPDDLKFRSSMTLFSLSADEPSLYLEALAKYFEGEKDALTVTRL